MENNIINFNTKRSYSLDLIKFISTICILCHHFQQGTGVRFKYINFWGGHFYFGRLVELFFIISGLLITKYMYHVGKNLSFSVFMKKRYFRLIPIVAICTFMDFIVRIIVGTISVENFAVNVLDTLTVALGIHGLFSTAITLNNPMWYISPLLLCYAVFYIMCYFARNNKLQTVCFPIIFILLGCIMLLGFDYPFFNLYIGRGLIAFFSGVLLSYFIYYIC